MCGIVGFISNERKKGWTVRRDVIKNLLVMDTLRGFHSTGVFGVPYDKKKTIRYIKKAVNAIDFLDMKNVESVMYDIDEYAFFVGHNRAATKGKVNNVNAHPFEIGELGIGVHNGTIRTGAGIDNFNSYEVDSEALLTSLLEKGSGEVIPQINGAFALVWHSYDDDRLHIIRNDERPMYFVKVKGEDTIIYGSEYFMLISAMVRNGMLEEYSWDAKEGREYIFDPANPMNFTTVDHELRERTTYHGNYSGVNYGNNRSNNNNNKSNTSSIQGREKDRDKKINQNLSKYGVKKGETINIVPFEYTPYGNSSTGMVHGCFDDGAVFPSCVIHGINGKRWANEMENQTLQGKVMGIQTKEGEDVLFIDGPTVKVKAGSKEVMFNGPNGRKMTQAEFNKATDEGCAYCTDNIFTDDCEWTQDGQPICSDCAEDREKLPAVVS